MFQTAGYFFEAIPPQRQTLPGLCVSASVRHTLNVRPMTRLTVVRYDGLSMGHIGVETCDEVLSYVDIMFIRLVMCDVSVLDSTGLKP